MFMDSTTIYWDYLSTEASHLMPTISSLEIMWIEASNHLKLSVFSSLTRLSIQKTFSCLEETTNALQSTEFMAFTTSAREGTTLSCGRPSLIVLTVFPLLLLLMRRSSACTEDCPQNWVVSNRSKESWDLLMCPILASSVIYFGQIPTKMSKAGERTIEVSALLSVRRSFLLSIRSTISIWSAEPTRSWRMGTSSLQRDNWWHYSAPPITVASSIMQVQWCLLMTLWCAVSRYWNQQKRNRSSHMEEWELEGQLRHLEPNTDWLMHSNIEDLIWLTLNSIYNYFMSN